MIRNLIRFFVLGLISFVPHIPAQTHNGATRYSVNGTVNAAQQAGPDIGAKINAAVALLPRGGEVYVPASTTCYRYTTPIVINAAIVLSGAATGTCLQFTAGTGVALTWNGGSTSLLINEQTGAGPRNLTIQTTVAGTTGVQLNAAGLIAENVNVMGFDTGVTFGSNTYIIDWHNGTLRNNKVALAFPTKGIQNSGENLTFDHVSFANGTLSDGVSMGTGCININVAASAPTAEFNFIDDSFDACQIVIGTNKGMQVRFINPHFEDVQSTLDYPFVKLTATTDGNVAQFINPEFFVDAKTTTQGSFVELNHYARANIVNGTAFVYGGTSVPGAWVAIRGAGSATLSVSGQLYGGFAGVVPTYSADGVNIPVVHLPAPSNSMTKYLTSDKQLVLAQGSHLSGDYWVTWADGRNRYHTVKVSVAVSSFSSTARLNILENYAYNSQPVLMSIKVVLSGTTPQLIATVSNRNGSTGPLTVQWSGDGAYSPQLLPGTLPGAGVVANNGLQQSPDGSLNVSGPAFNSIHGFAVNSVPGYTGTKTIGTCLLTIQGGIITNVSGC